MIFELIFYLVFTLGFLSLPFLPIYIWWKKKKERIKLKEKATKQEYIRGSKITNNLSYFNNLLSDNTNNHLLISTVKGNIYIPSSVIKQHIGIIGTTGAGKTQLIKQIFKELDNKKKIIIDVKGDYLSSFNKDRDIIFCPLDERCKGWNIFNDIENYQDIRNIAYALVPENTKSKDPYWDNASRNIVEGILIYLSKEARPTNKDLWEYLTDFDKLVNILDKDEEAKALLTHYINTKDRKHTKEILANILSQPNIRALEQLKDINGYFSFKEWVSAKARKSNIYLLAQDDLINSLLPIYRIVIEIMSSKLLSLPDNNDYELYFFLDELPKLKKLHKIIDLMTLARSKGGRVIYSIQTIKQLEEVYEKELATTIIDTTNTMFIFRTSDAEYLEKLLGQQEVWEHSLNEKKSAFLEKLEDSITKSRKTKPLILASQIQGLENLEFYLKSIIPDAIKSKLKYIEYPKITQSFIKKERKIQKRKKKSTLDNIEDMLNDLEKPKG